MRIYKDPIENLALRQNPDVCHAEAADMFESYGWHVSTDDGDYCLQVVDTAWLDSGKTEAEIVDLILAESRVDDRDVAVNIADTAVSVWRDMKAIEDALARAVEAAWDGNLAGCVEALTEAGDLESEHGDYPATRELSDKLLVRLGD